jgi:hypothetical protein
MTRRNQAAGVPEETFEDQFPEVAEDQAPEREMTEEEKRIEERAHELAEQMFAKMKAEDAAKKSAGKPKPEKRKHDLPEGYIAPVGFRHALVAAGLASESMSPVQIYGLVRKSSSNGMPVKHFDRAGNAFSETQTHPVTGETITRPGLKLDEGLEWWQNRPARQPGQPKEKNETAAEKAADAEAETADLQEEFAEEDFAEAE